MQSALTHTSARVLEFESLRDLVRGYASSPLGQGRIAELSPSVDRLWIENQHQLTTEIREFRRVGGRFEFSGLMDISTTVEKARIQGAVLETTEIRDVVLVVDRAAEWREIALSPPAAMKVEWTAVAELSSGIMRFHGVSAGISQQDPARRYARRSRLAGTGPNPARDRTAEEGDPGVIARLSAPAGRRRRGAG